jgi:hypothetical protein
MDVFEGGDDACACVGAEDEEVLVAGDEEVGLARAAHSRNMLSLGSRQMVVV